MAVSERNLKVLWGRAAGCCSICKIQITVGKESVTDAYPFGENAHIVAESPDGPRGDASFPDTLLNHYLNLILLCPNCHTKVDQAPEDYPVEKLHQLKRDHEDHVAGSRSKPPDKDSYDEFFQ